MSVRRPTAFALSATIETNGSYGDNISVLIHLQLHKWRRQGMSLYRPRRRRTQPLNQSQRHLSPDTETLAGGGIELGEQVYAAIGNQITEYQLC